MNGDLMEGTVMAQCTATSKQSGERCRRHAVPGKRVCVMHGGRSRAGTSHPGFKDGRFSKVLPARLAERYRASVADPELLSFRADISAIDARIEDVLHRLDAGESPDLWPRMQAGVAALIAAHSCGSQIDAPLRALQALADAGSEDWAAWREIMDGIDARRKLVLAESRRLSMMEQFITAEEALALMEAMVASVRANVQDRDALQRIATDFARLTNRRDLIECDIER
jgi:hypothetical protein